MLLSRKGVLNDLLFEGINVFPEVAPAVSSESKALFDDILYSNLNFTELLLNTLN